MSILRHSEILPDSTNILKIYVSKYVMDSSIDFPKSAFILFRKVSASGNLKFRNEVLIEKNFLSNLCPHREA